MKEDASVTNSHFWEKLAGINGRPCGFFLHLYENVLYWMYPVRK